MTPVLFALSVTLAVETPIVAALYPGERTRMALVAFVTNVVTNVSMNTLLFQMARSYASYLLIGETAAVLFETLAYFILARHRDFGRALVASAVANAASYGAGLVLG